MGQVAGGNRLLLPRASNLLRLSGSPKSMLPRRWLLRTTALAAAALTPQAAHAQVRAVTPADSINLVLEAYSVLLDNTGTRAITGPIWLESDTAADSMSRFHLSSKQAKSILESDPRVRLVSEREDLYLCPPGREVRMPVSGCPIRESGVIVTLQTWQRDATTLIIIGSVVKSGTSGRHTWAEILGVAFRWDDAGWKYSGIEFRGET
jgi:hypothetical protein